MRTLTRPLLLSAALVTAASAPAPVQAGGVPAVYGVLQLDPPSATFEGTAPTFALWAADRPAVFAVECTVGGEKMAAQSGTIEAGERWVVTLPAKPPVTTASCGLFASFANGMSERKAQELSWTWKPIPPPEPEAAPPAPKPAPKPASTPQPAPKPAAAPAGPPAPAPPAPRGG
jgi:hypothetical protein